MRYSERLIMRLGARKTLLPALVLFATGVSRVVSLSRGLGAERLGAVRPAGVEVQHPGSRLYHSLSVPGEVFRAKGQRRVGFRLAGSRSSPPLAARAGSFRVGRSTLPTSPKPSGSQSICHRYYRLTRQYSLPLR